MPTGEEDEGKAKAEALDEGKAEAEALDEAAAEIQWVCLQYLRRKAQRDLDAKANKR